MAEQITGADLRLCLPRNEIPTADFIALAKELMLFKPTGFTANRAVRHFRRLGRRIYWDILQQNLEEDAVFESKAHGDYGGALTFRSYPETGTIEAELWNGSDCDFETVREIVQRFTQTHPVICGTLRTVQEALWNRYGSYIVNGVNYSLKSCTHEHPELPEIRLDSSGNIDNTQFSGYGTSFCGLWFGCSYEMWFGKAYDKYIPHALLTSFTHCEQNEILENGTVHIVMYDAPDAFKSEESLRRAWSWRAHTDYISLAAEWQKRLEKT